MTKKPKKKKTDRLKKTASSAAQLSGSGKFLDSLIEYGPLLLLGITPLIAFRMAGEFDNNSKLAFLHWTIPLLALTRVLRVNKAKPFTWKRTPLDIPVLLFCLFCFLSLLQALNPYTAVLSLANWTCVTVFYFFLINTLKDEEAIEDFFFIAAISVALISVLGILQKFLNVDWVIQLSSPSSTFSNRNMAGQFVAITFPLTIGSIVLSKRHWMKYSAGVCLFISLVYLVFTTARSAQLAVLATAVIMTAGMFSTLSFSELRKKILVRKRLLYAGLFVVIIGGVFLLSPARKSLNLDLLQERLQDSSTIKLRKVWWQNTLVMVKDHFWWGVGLGNFKLQYPLYNRAVAKDRSFRERMQVNRVHNDHLQILVELGFFGFCVYVMMFIIFFYLSWRLFSKHQSERVRLYVLFLSASVTAFMIIAFFTFPIERAMPPLYLFTCFGLVGFLYLQHEGKHVRVWEIRWQATMRVLLSLLLIAFLCSSVYFIQKIVRSDRYFVQGMTLSKRGVLEESNKYLKKAHLFSRWNFNIANLLARNLTMQGKYEEAIKSYMESFLAHPNNTNGIMNVGFCNLKLKNYDEAEKYFLKYLEYVPDSEKAYNNMGIIYFSKQQPDKAMACYEKAISLREDYPEPYFNIGNLYRSQRNIHEAIKYYEKALEYKTSMDDARTILNKLYHAAGEPKKARDVMLPIMKQNEKKAEKLLIEGNRYQAGGKYQQALELYKRAQKLIPENAVPYHDIAVIYFLMNDLAEAEKYVTRAININPQLAESHNLKAQIYIRKKQPEKALRSFKFAIINKPKLKDAQYNIGNLCVQMGKHEEAVEAYNKTLAIDPGFSPAHFALAMVFKQQGNREKALYHFEKAIEKPHKLVDREQIKKFIAELTK